MKSIGSENMHVEQLRISNKLKFDVSDLLESIHREAAFFLQFSKNENISWIFDNVYF